jgi:hypothetical protein
VQSLSEQLGRLESGLSALSRMVEGTLTPQQQHVLAQLQRGFDALPPVQQQAQAQVHTPARSAASHYAHSSAKLLTPLRRSIGRTVAGSVGGVGSSADRGGVRELLHIASMAGGYSRQQSAGVGGQRAQGQAAPQGPRRRRHSDSELY